MRGSYVLQARKVISLVQTGQWRMTLQLDAARALLHGLLQIPYRLRTASLHFRRLSQQCCSGPVSKHAQGQRSLPHFGQWGVILQLGPAPALLHGPLQKEPWPSTGCHHRHHLGWRCCLHGAQQTGGRRGSLQHPGHQVIPPRLVAALGSLHRPLQKLQQWTAWGL